MTGFARRLAAAFGLYAVPVKCVVEHLGRIVENDGIIGNSSGLLDNVHQRHFFEIGSGSQLVDIADIAGVMFSVMILDGFGGNVGFEVLFFERQRPSNDCRIDRLGPADFDHTGHVKRSNGAGPKGSF